MTTPTTLRWDMPWRTPPISLNDRQHWRPRARKVKEVRAAARILAMAAHLPRDLDHVTVQLVYQPRDRRRRDEDNLVGTLKAICDGLIDYGITPDDTPQYMTKLMPRIDPPVKGQTGRIWLELEWETT
ncbi:hypothetical protein [Rhodococcus sp. NPDC006774]|uniref:hypothetical protein n=1 Tax=Rhodococcus sp. NPDC006774 TaxID=3157186 RepID=UPI003405C94F